MMQKRQKILLVITKGGIGGAQRYVRDLRTFCDQKRFEVKIIAGNENNDLPTDIVVPHMTNAINPLALFWNDWYALYELIAIFRKEQPDIVHLNSSKAGVVGSIAAAWCKIPCIFTVHGWVFNPTNDLSIFEQWSYIILHWIAARFQNRIICVAEFDRQLALQYHIKSPTSINTIPIGIDNKTQKLLTKVTARNNLAKLAELQGFAIDPKKPWIGSIGRLVREKNYATLIVSMMHIDANLVIIGEGSECEQLKNQIKKYGLHERAAIIMLLQPAAAYCNAFNIFVLPSIKEGLPYTLLEAMNASLPIIVTNVGGMPEAIQNRTSGFVVPPRNPNVLGTAIQTLLNDTKLAKTYGAAAKKRLETEYALEKMIKRTENVYNDFSAARKVSD